MTSNQIEYAKYLETKRHNLASEHFSSRERATAEYEAETRRLSQEESVRHDIVQESLTDWANKETHRYNVAKVGIDYSSLEESRRHNQQYELIQSASQQEQARHNYAMEQLESMTISENARHNLAIEQENVRHNVANERIGRAEVDVGAANARANAMNAVTNAKNADINATNAQTRVKELEETHRQNTFRFEADMDANSIQRERTEVQDKTNRLGTFSTNASKLIGTAAMFFK